MTIKKEPGKGLIAKVRSKRVATVNNRKGSGKFEDFGVQRKGNPIKMTAEQTKEGKNIFGKKVVKDRYVDPGKDGTFSVRKQKMTSGNDGGVGTKTKIKVKTYDSTGKRIATGKAKMTSSPTGYKTKEKVRNNEGKSVLKTNIVDGRTQVKKATGKFRRLDTFFK